MKTYTVQATYQSKARYTAFRLSRVHAFRHAEKLMKARPVLSNGKVISVTVTQD